jgi:FkbM family methyltransferase
MNKTMISANTSKIRFYSTLMRVRPAQLGSFLKKCLYIRRQYIQTTTGHMFWIDPVSVFGLHLLCEGCYEPQMTRLLELVLRTSDIFIDIGGNEGYFTVIASLLAPGVQVHCVEPQSRLQPVLAENIRVNNVQSIVVHPVAISDVDDQIRLFLRPSTNTGASSMFRHWRLGATSETVPALRLDTFFEKNSLDRVRLLKVDCEGAEYSVIRGAKRVLRRQAFDFIAMEYHPSICGIDHCVRADQELRAGGYVLTKVRGQYIYHLPGLEEELLPLGELKVGCDWDG